MIFHQRWAVALAAIALMGGTVQAPGAVSASLELFYSGLGDGGEWFEHPDYGYVWQPRITVSDSAWRPYADGYWAYTDAGYTWVSYEPWGWATYHYGRWTRLGVRWCWVPGYDWAPAWVSWRHGGGYVGWCPLPPDALWDWGAGFGIHIDIDFGIGPGWYNFVHERHFGDPYLGPVIVNVQNNITIINETVNITNITYNDYGDHRIVYNGGPNYEKISAKTDHKIPKLALDRVKDTETKDKFAKQKGDKLVIVGPDVVKGDGKAKPEKLGSLEKDLAKEDKGWDIVKDEKVRAKLESKLKTEGSGVEAKKTDREPQGPLDAEAGGKGEKPGKLGKKDEGVVEPGDRTGDRGVGEKPKGDRVIKEGKLPPDTTTRKGLGGAGSKTDKERGGQLPQDLGTGKTKDGLKKGGGVDPTRGYRDLSDQKPKTDPSTRSGGGSGKKLDGSGGSKPRLDTGGGGSTKKMGGGGTSTPSGGGKKATGGSGKKQQSAPPPPGATPTPSPKDKYR